MNNKSQIWISVIIYTLVAVLTLVIVLNTGIPILTEIREKAAFSRIKDIMVDLDRHITEIARQSEGSQATVSFEVRDGVVKFANNQLIWEIETDSKIISPRSKTQLGNLIISSNANVITYETPQSYVMKTTIRNDTFQVAIKKIGSQTSWQPYTTSELVQNLSYNGDNMDGTFKFNLNGNASTATGTGYTRMIPSGNNTNMGSAKIVAFMNSTFGTYDIEFTLESYADFVTVNVKNFVPKS